MKIKQIAVFTRQEDQKDPTKRIIRAQCDDIERRYAYPTAIGKEALEQFEITAHSFAREMQWKDTDGKTIVRRLKSTKEAVIYTCEAIESEDPDHRAFFDFQNSLDENKPISSFTPHEIFLAGWAARGKRKKWSEKFKKYSQE